LNKQFHVDYLRDVTYIKRQSKKHDIGLITGLKDRYVTQIVNYNGLIPILISEIQNLKSNIQKLEYRISELEKIYIQNILAIKSFYINSYYKDL